MKEEVIKVDHLTKDYGNQKGIFDLSFSIQKGEMVGFVGTNGSGKTTTIRCLLGFIKPTSGHAYIKGRDTWIYSSDLLKYIGYVPGEISFPDLKTGNVFLKSQAAYFQLPDMSYANQLIQRLHLDTKANLKRMSKRMKQKTALVAALMNHADILILDEPTTGLDPLMRKVFLDIIKKQHQLGKTILMSSHMFEEIESTCDKVVLISDGKIVDCVDMNSITKRSQKDYKIEFLNEQDYLSFKRLSYTIIRDQPQYSQVTVRIDQKDVNRLVQDLKNYSVKFIAEIKYNLEKYFQETLKKQKEKKKNV